MEIHKPRPVRNLRELLSEIGVIVVGVVIALTAEQMLQGFELRHRVRLAEEQMRQEIAGDDGPQVLQRIALSPCVDENLNAIRAAVERGDLRGAVLEVADRFDTPRHTWDSVAFQAAASAGVLSQLPPDRLGLLSYFYSMMPILDRADEREYHDAAALHAVSRVGGALTESERLRLLDAVETLRRDDADVTKHVVLARDAMNQLGIRTEDWRRPAGAMVSLREPGRVVDQLAGLPMARACLPALKTALEATP